MVFSPPNQRHLQQRLGYRFQQVDLLNQALTHRSRQSQNNERLEFLGDAILNAVVSRHLYETYPEASEGQLTRLRAQWVCERTLAELARFLNLSQHLILGAGEKKGGGAFRPAILADALEALIGAIYLEAGWAVCEPLVLSWYSQSGLTPTLEEASHKDAKTRLQEWIQARQGTLPVYHLLSMSGDDHHPCFEVACELTDRGILIKAEAKSRKLAEQLAAERVLDQLNHQDASS